MTGLFTKKTEEKIGRFYDRTVKPPVVSRWCTKAAMATARRGHPEWMAELPIAFSPPPHLCRTETSGEGE